MTGSLYIVSTPIGNPDDITLRALSTLKTVAAIAAEDPQCTQALLARHGITTPLTSYHNENMEEKIPVLIQRMKEGQSIALVSDAGTPAIVDPGARLIHEALKQNIPVVSVPGPSALLAALTASNLPGEAFVFIGPLPSQPAACRKLLRALRPERRTIVGFGSSVRLSATLKTLRAELGNRRIAVACNLTTPTEQWIRGTIDGILHAHTAQAARGELTLVIEGARPGRKNRSKRKQN